MVWEDPRVERGKEIAATEGAIERIGDDVYKVRSTSSPTRYHVEKRDNVWVCSCPDNVTRKKVCKHIIAVQIVRQKEDKPYVKPAEKPECYFCHRPMDAADRMKYGKVCPDCRSKDREWYKKVKL